MSFDSSIQLQPKNEETFRKFMKFQGILEKKNPKIRSIINIYQKRFFCIRDQGTKLVYYKKEPKEKDIPKGIIEIKDIQSIRKIDSHNFEIQYMERTFELRTLKTDSDCVQWIRVLEYLQNYNYERSKMMKSVTSVIEAPQKTVKESWKKNSDENLLHTIREENKEVQASKSIDFDIPKEEEDDTRDLRSISSKQPFSYDKEISEPIIESPEESPNRQHLLDSEDSDDEPIVNKKPPIDEQTGERMQSVRVEDDFPDQIRSLNEKKHDLEVIKELDNAGLVFGGFEETHPEINVSNSRDHALNQALFLSNLSDNEKKEPEKSEIIDPGAPFLENYLNFNEIEGNRKITNPNLVQDINEEIEIIQELLKEENQLEIPESATLKEEEEKKQIEENEQETIPNQDLNQALFLSNLSENEKKEPERPEIIDPGAPFLENYLNFNETPSKIEIQAAPIEEITQRQREEESKIKNETLSEKQPFEDLPNKTDQRNELPRVENLQTTQANDFRNEEKERNRDLITTEIVKKVDDFEVNEPAKKSENPKIERTSTLVEEKSEKDPFSGIKSKTFGEHYARTNEPNFIQNEKVLKKKRGFFFCC